MKSKKTLLIPLIFILIAIIFFYKTIIYGYIPFPGDLLVSEYEPWRSYSYLGYVSGSYPSKVQYFDVIRQIYPWKTLSIDLLKNAQLPFWNPYNFSGSPLIANFQSAVFYPFNIFYFIFSQTTSWAILVILQPILASLFTYLYARKIGINIFGSIISSLTFSYSLFMSVFLEYNTIGHVIAWLPLLLYFSERIIKELSAKNIVFFVASLILSFLAGHIQIFGFLSIFVFVYFILRLLSLKWNNSKKLFYFIFLIFLFLISLGISAIQLFPTLELINLSARSTQNYQFLVEKLLLQFNQLIGLISPDFFGNPATRNYILSDSYPGNAIYVGLFPFVFSVLSLSIYKKNYYVKLFAIFSLIFFIFFIRNPVSEIFYRFEIPFFSTGSPTNAIFLLSFSLSILAGFGFDHWFKANSKFNNKILIIIALSFMMIWTSIFVFKIEVSLKNFVYSTILFLVFLSISVLFPLLKAKKNYLAFLFIIIIIFDLFYFFQKFNPFVPEELVFPQAKVFSYLEKITGPNRVWENGVIEPNFHSKYSLFSVEGYDPIYSKTYGEFVQSSLNGKIQKIFTNRTRSDAKISTFSSDPAANKYLWKILNILGVKYILDKSTNSNAEKTFLKDKFSLIYDDQNWRIYENKDVLPRAFLTSSYKAYKDEKEFEKLFFADGFDPLKTVLVEKDVGGFVNNNQDEPDFEKVDFVSYAPNKIILKTKAKTKKLLFLSDSYYPGWKATVDNLETKIYKANYTFRAIIVPSGEHQVIFEYQPESFYLGLKVSIISFVILIITILLVKNKHEK